MTKRGLRLAGLLLCISVALPLACGEGDNSDSDADPAPAGFADFREFAAGVPGALAAADAEFFLGRSSTQDGLCTGRETVPPCAGMPAGSSYPGRLVQAGVSDPFVLSEEQYAEQLRSYLDGAVPSLSDQLGAGEITLVALATPPQSDNRIQGFLPSGRSAYYAITSGIVNRGSDNRREVHVLIFSRGDGDWGFVGEVLPASGGNPAEAYAAWLNGSCAGCYDYFEPFQVAPS